MLKEPEANVVRVFDLATLSAEYGADANPFAHSVALMCYRMALRCNSPASTADGAAAAGASATDSAADGAAADGARASGVDSREDAERRRDLLLQSAELLDRHAHSLLFSLVQVSAALIASSLPPHRLHHLTTE